MRQPTNPAFDIAHLGHIEILTDRFDESLDFFTRVYGLCLSALDGVGVWTAEMLLIFSLQRPDVVSWGDLAIRRGMMALYGLNSLTRTQFDNYRKRYSPYGSVASLYLWALAARKPEAMNHAADRRGKMAGSPSKQRRI